MWLGVDYLNTFGKEFYIRLTSCFIFFLSILSSVGLEQQFSKLMVMGSNPIECNFVLKWIEKNQNDTKFFLKQEKFKYLKTTHSYQFLDPNLWSTVAVFGAFMVNGWSCSDTCINLLVVGSLLTTEFCVISYLMYLQLVVFSVLIFSTY